MSTAHLYENDTLLCDIRRISRSNDKEFMFQAAQLLPFSESDALYIITDVAPSIGMKHHITFDHLRDTLHIEVKSVMEQPPDFISRCTYIERS